MFGWGLGFCAVLNMVFSEALGTEACIPVGRRGQGRDVVCAVLLRCNAERPAACKQLAVIPTNYFHAFIVTPDRS